MLTSIIIPTYNGKHKLAGVLTALADQTNKDFELIIAIDGSNDGTEEFLSDFDSQLSFKIYNQNNQGRSSIRNKGASVSRGELLIFIDDDMRPTKSFVEEHISHHKKFPGSMVSGAQIDDPTKAQTAFQKYKCAISKRWAEPLRKHGQTPLSRANLHLTAANFSISKTLFNHLGGFDENLRDAEDFDLAARAIIGKIPVYYKHDAFAWHDDFTTTKGYIKRLREYQAAHDTLLKLKPDLYNELTLRRPVKLKGFKKIAFSFFCNSHLLNAMEHDSAIIRLAPELLRNWLFDVTTTSYGVFFTDKIIS